MKLYYIVSVSMNCGEATRDIFISTDYEEAKRFLMSAPQYDFGPAKTGTINVYDKYMRLVKRISFYNGVEEE